MCHKIDTERHLEKFWTRPTLSGHAQVNSLWEVQLSYELCRHIPILLFYSVNVSAG